MAHRVREGNRTLSDKVIHLVFIALHERRNANDHLEDKDAQAPPVQRMVVSVSDQHLWC